MTLKKTTNLNTPSKKLYILDTNVLIHDPKSMLEFQGAMVGIPLTVIEELDHFKTDNSQRGFSAREAIRTLDKLRSQGSLREGVVLEHGGTVQVLPYDAEQVCAKLFGEDEPDNRILSVAFYKQQAGYDVVFITKDLNMRVKADAIGLPAVDYLRDVVHVDEFYRGWRTIQVPAVQLNKQEIPDDVRELAQSGMLMYNEYIIAESNHNPHHYKLLQYTGEKKVVVVRHPSLDWAFEARNVQQLMALDLLLNDKVPIVTLMGPAGTGKTLLVLVAALYKVLVEEIYTKLLVSRPIIPLGPDIGYLPGELQEKLYNWMQPVYDNMELIGHMVRGSALESFNGHNGHSGQNGQQHAPEQKHEKFHGSNDHGRRKHKHRNRGLEHERPHNLSPSSFHVEQLMASGKLNLEAITYMRGRSIPYRYIFIDEVQNLTPHEVKTIVSRVGEGSKIVLAGDPYQIDSPYLDFSSNGLMVLTDRFKNQSLFGSVFLQYSERSSISKLAGELL